MHGHDDTVDRGVRRHAEHASHGHVMMLMMTKMKGVVMIVVVMMMTRTLSPRAGRETGRPRVSLDPRLADAGTVHLAKPIPGRGLGRPSDGNGLVMIVLALVLKMVLTTMTTVVLVRNNHIVLLSFVGAVCTLHLCCIDLSKRRKSDRCGNVRYTECWAVAALV